MPPKSSESKQRKKRDYTTGEIEEFQTYLDEYKDINLQEIEREIKELRSQKNKIMRKMGRKNKKLNKARDQQTDEEKKFFSDEHKKKSEKSRRMAALYQLKRKKQETPLPEGSKMSADINLLSKMPSYLRPFKN